MVESPQRAGADLDSVFKALADPTRRAIVASLAGAEASLTTVAGPFEMTLPAVAKHVGVLERAGLVAHVRVGREKRLRLVARPLGEAERWLESYRSFWDDRLASLDTFLARDQRT
ncbi:MAG: helix-turn-helix transcriptional regulator [Candidatus Dormibacteraeota bacterium]|nr:helix-turn-helix transcriptional regulator [Candidatus Dormibacteraeota bacterium]